MEQMVVGLVQQLMSLHEAFGKRLLALLPEDGEELAVEEYERRSTEAVEIALDACCPETTLVALSIASRLKAEAATDDSEEERWDTRARRLMTFADMLEPEEGE